MPKIISRNLIKAPRYRFIELRKIFLITQRAAADEFGVTDTYIRMLEKGTADPSTDLLFRIAHRFGVDVYDCWPDIAGSRPQ